MQSTTSVFVHLFGTRRWKTLFLVCGTLVTLGWCGDNLWIVLTDLQAAMEKPWEVFGGILLFA